MQRRIATLWRLVSLLMLLILAREARAAVTISFCDKQPGCLCIDWDRGHSSYLEVRCPEGSGGTPGWTKDPTGETIDDPGSGGWRGPGGSQPSDAPGSPLTGELAFHFTRAKDGAWQAVRGDSEIGPTGKPMYTLNECSTLFFGNPMGVLGHNLIESYIVGRYGEGVKTSDGKTPCNDPAISIWTTCCQHDPDIFVCQKFENLTASHQIALLIHETMHVAGQTEDQTTVTGPGDAPTTSDITRIIREACSL